MSDSTHSDTSDGDHSPAHSQSESREQDHLQLPRRAALTGLASLSGLSMLGSRSTAAQEPEEYLTAAFVETPRIGTTNANPGPLVVQVNTEQALRIEPTEENRGANLIGGHADNTVADGVVSATIAGGGPFDPDRPAATANVVYDNYGTIGGGTRNQAGIDDGDPTTAKFTSVGGGSYNEASGPTATVGGGGVNQASGKLATIGGGYDNKASSEYATVGGGAANRASGQTTTVGGGGDNQASGGHATVGGGASNEASKRRATVGGGGGNQASSEYATVSGGAANEASGRSATVPGGAGNTADGRYSVATGRQADANGFDGAFVLGDSSETAFAAQNPDEVRSQMPVYAPAFNTTSARAQKTGMESVDPEAVLAGVEQLAVTTWEFTDTDDGRHMGPMADDFHATFGVGDDADSIATVDADGVAFAAIQGLSKQLDAKDDRIEELEAERDHQTERIDELEERLASLEAHVGTAKDVPATD